MIVSYGAMTAHRRSDRCVEQFSQFREQVAGARKDDAPATDKGRSLGGEDDIGCGSNQFAVRARAISGEGRMARIRPDVGCRKMLLLQIIGQADMRGARPPRRRRAESGAEDVRDLADMVDHAIPLGQRREQGALVEFGQGIATPCRYRDVGGDG